MNFKKLFSIIMVCCCAGTTLHTMEQDYISLRKYKTIKDPYQWYTLKSKPNIKDLATRVSADISAISRLEKEIINIKRTNLLLGGITGLATGILAYTTLFKNVQPTYRGLGSVATLVGTALLGYSLTRCMMNHIFNVPRHEKLLERYSQYLPTIKINQNDKHEIYVKLLSEQQAAVRLNPVANRVRTLMIQQGKGMVHDV